MTNITNFQDILGAANGDQPSVLGKFLYFSLANILVEKEALAQLCEDLSIPYSGSKRISVSDAFRSATGDIKDRITVKNPGEHHIYAVYCRDNAHTEDVYSRELVKETLNQRTNQYEKLANIFYDRRDNRFGYDNIGFDADIDPLNYCRRAEELFELYQTCANRRQIETICLSYLRMLEATKVSTTGHLYFIPRQHMDMLLKDFFAYAMRKYRMPCNPTIDTARPTVITPEMRVLSPSEMQVFIEEVMRETQRVAILTTLFVGFRVGEVLALKISDLDLEKQTLSVTKNLIRVPTAAVSPENPNIEILNYDQKKKTHLIVQNTPKTSTSNREIAISDGLCELLIRHLFTLANSTWPNPDGLLFPSKAGTHLDPKSFEIRLAAVSKRCEIRKVNPHALRHTLATRLVEDKVPLNIVQGILGHSSIETTRKYLHKNEDIEREAIGMMSNYLNMGQMEAAPRLNGAAPRAKFADVVLPTFPQRRNHTA